MHKASKRGTLVVSLYRSNGTELATARDSLVAEWGKFVMWGAEVVEARKVPQASVGI